MKEAGGNPDRKNMFIKGLSGLAIMGALFAFIGCTRSITLNLAVDGIPVSDEIRTLGSPDPNCGIRADWYFARWYPKPVACGKGKEVEYEPFSQPLAFDELNTLPEDTKVVAMHLRVVNPKSLRYRVTKVWHEGDTAVREKEIIYEGARVNNIMVVRGPLVPGRPVSLGVIISTIENETDKPLLYAGDLQYRLRGAATGALASRQERRGIPASASAAVVKPERRVALAAPAAAPLTTPPSAPAAAPAKAPTSGAGKEDAADSRWSSAALTSAWGEASPPEFVDSKAIKEAASSPAPAEKDTAAEPARRTEKAAAVAPASGAGPKGPVAAAPVTKGRVPVSAPPKEPERWVALAPPAAAPIIAPPAATAAPAPAKAPAPAAGKKEAADSSWSSGALTSGRREASPPEFPDSKAAKKAAASPAPAEKEAAVEPARRTEKAAVASAPAAGPPAPVAATPVAKGRIPVSAPPVKQERRVALAPHTTAPIIAPAAPALVKAPAPAPGKKDAADWPWKSGVLASGWGEASPPEFPDSKATKKAAGSPAPAEKVGAADPASRTGKVAAVAPTLGAGPKSPVAAASVEKGRTPVSASPAEQERRVALAFSGAAPIIAPPAAPMAASPTVRDRIFYVSTAHEYLRACPEPECRAIAVLDRNEAVEKVGEVLGWSQVRVKRTGRLGWINTAYLASPPGSTPAAAEKGIAAITPVASRPAAQGRIFYLNADHEYLRSCPDPECETISVLARHDAVEKVEEAADWSRVRVKRSGRSGWVRTLYLSAQPGSLPLAAPTASSLAPPPGSWPLLYVVVDLVNLRTAPSLDAPKLSVLKQGDEVEKVGEAKDWTQVRLRHTGRLGWINSVYLASRPGPTPPVAGKDSTVTPHLATPHRSQPILYVTVDRLSLRAGPGLDTPRLSVLNRDEEVEKVGEVEDWTRVRVKRNGHLGWINTPYLASRRGSRVPEAPPGPLIPATPRPKPPSATRPVTQDLKPASPPGQVGARDLPPRRGQSAASLPTPGGKEKTVDFPAARGAGAPSRSTSQEGLEKISRPAAVGESPSPAKPQVAGAAPAARQAAPPTAEGDEGFRVWRKTTLSD
jgi:SH3-like domain-containing protein